MSGRNNGPSEQWAVGIMGCRNNGSSELWAVGIMTRNRVYLNFKTSRINWKTKHKLLKRFCIVWFGLIHYSAFPAAKAM